MSLRPDGCRKSSDQQSKKQTSYHHTTTSSYWANARVNEMDACWLASLPSRTVRLPRHFLVRLDGRILQSPPKVRLSTPPSSLPRLMVSPPPPLLHSPSSPQPQVGPLEPSSQSLSSVSSHNPRGSTKLNGFVENAYWFQPVPAGSGDSHRPG